MPDQTQSNNQTMVYALVAIAVLLAAIVGFMIYQRTTAIPAPTVSATNSPAATAPSATTPGASTAAPQSSSVPAAEFDEKTATKLPAGMTPEKALKAYNDAVLANKFDAAYALLPLAQQQSYASADGMASQVKPYGITGFKVGTPQTQGDDVVIVVETQNPSMPITYTWAFTKVGDTWYVKSRTMGGSL